MSGRPRGSASATTEADENDESLGYWEPRGEDESFPPTARKPSRLVSALKALFREVAKALTHKTPAPKPSRRRRREEETRGGFTLAAISLLCRVVRAIFDDDTVTRGTSAWPDNAQLYALYSPYWNHTDTTDTPQSDFHYTEQNDLSPRL